MCDPPQIEPEAKSCGTCIYWNEEEMVDGSRRCNWFSATQLGRGVLKYGPSWHAAFRSMLTYQNNGRECVAHEPVE